MNGALLLAATGTLAAFGLGLIALSQKQHRRLAPGVSGRPAALRISGGGLIALAVWPAVVRDGLAFGLLAWATVLTFSALVVVAVLARSHGRRGGLPKDE